MRPHYLSLCAIALVGLSPTSRAGNPPTTSIAGGFGHSMQGEAFNDGPRQRARALPGIARIHFPITTARPAAQRFFAQGVAQLHAYWYFEAERSFRQASALDPDCAMAYWGMARANVNNRERAKGFCEVAMQRRAPATPRERAWIEALAIWAGADPGRPKDDKNRDADYVAALRKLVKDYPADIEAKAFLAKELQERAYQQGNEAEAETLLQAVLAKSPMHPAHHYRIHLWDRPGNEKAADSADRCGPSQPASAHMWHMSGHTYTQLKRYADAAWAQEASARVDHAHQRAARLLPDQIFNYAHNNQWLCESLGFVGRAHQALTIARNLVEHPRHPRLNTLDGYASAGQGQGRLIETLYRYELWPETMAAFHDGLLEPTKARDRERERATLLAIAANQTGDATTARRFRQQLEAMALADNAAKPLLAEVDAWTALAAGDRDGALRAIAGAKIDTERVARLYGLAGAPAKAEEMANKAVDEGRGRFLPLARRVIARFANGHADEARRDFETLRRLGSQADLSTPIARELAPIARTLGYPIDWRLPAPAAVDHRFRPKLETLGPLLWSPTDAPALSLPDSRGQIVSLESYRARHRPVLVVFFLGLACRPCMAQLDAVAKRTAALAEAGVDVVAVTPDTPSRIARFLAEPGNAARFPFPILTDTGQKTFRAFGAYDDFETMPLHGAFLIDEEGKLRWHDTGFQPFTDIAFLEREARRLLAQNR